MHCVHAYLPSGQKFRSARWLCIVLCYHSGPLLHASLEHVLLIIQLCTCVFRRLSVLCCSMLFPPQMYMAVLPASDVLIAAMHALPAQKHKTKGCAVPCRWNSGYSGYSTGYDDDPSASLREGWNSLVEKWQRWPAEERNPTLALGAGIHACTCIDSELSSLFLAYKLVWCLIIVSLSCQKILSMPPTVLYAVLWGQAVPVPYTTVNLTGCYQTCVQGLSRCVCL
jgi:hypothetical protein